MVHDCTYIDNFENLSNNIRGTQFSALIFLQGTQFTALTFIQGTQFTAFEKREFSLGLNLPTPTIIY